jgi:hypothetical protein
MVAAPTLQRVAARCNIANRLQGVAATLQRRQVRAAVGVGPGVRARGGEPGQSRVGWADVCRPRLVRQGASLRLSRYQILTSNGHIIVTSVVSFVWSRWSTERLL